MAEKRAPDAGESQVDRDIRRSREACERLARIENGLECFDVPMVLYQCRSTLRLHLPDLVARALVEGWADYTHVALLAASVLIDGPGGIILQRDHAHAISRSPFGIFLSVGRDKMIHYPFQATPTYDATQSYALFTAVYHPRFRDPDVPHQDIEWINMTTSRACEALIRAIETNRHRAQVLAEVLPVALVPELVSEYALVSGIEAVHPRFDPTRKRASDSALAKAFAKRKA